MSSSSSCMQTMCDLKLDTKEKSKAWLLQNAPDKGGNVDRRVFSDVAECHKDRTFCATAPSARPMPSPARSTNSSPARRKSPKPKADTRKRDKIYSCMRQVANWSKILPAHKFDSSKFSTKAVQEALQVASPKMEQLFKIIADLDAQDLKTHKKQFKHFIFSDVKEQGYGAKILASGFAAVGYKNLIVQRGGHLALAKTSGAGPSASAAAGAAFAVLSSSSIFGAEFSQKLKKEVLQTFNKRPDNIHGEEMRFIILDSGFKEGIDLFDVKYVHIFEPSMTTADLKQTIGRATRTCGQKGLNFEPNVGWPLYVYNYFIAVPPDMQDAYKVPEQDLALLNESNRDALKMRNDLPFHGTQKLKDATILYTDFDQALVNLSEQLYKLAPIFSVDFELTKDIHKIDDISYLYDKTAQSAASPLLAITHAGGASIAGGAGGAKKILRDIESINCAGKCGLRSTHDIPASVDFLKRVYLTNKHDKNLLPSVGGLRKFFCGYMQSNPAFCTQVNDEWSKRAALVPHMLEENMKKTKNNNKTKKQSTKKQITKKQSTKKQSTKKQSTKKQSAKSTKSTKSSRSNKLAIVPYNPQRKAESIKQTLDIVPYTSPQPATKTNYAILKYVGVKKPALKLPTPGPPPTKLNFTEMRNFIKTNYIGHFKWPELKIENKCEAAATGGAPAPSGDVDKILKLNPTQDFVMHFFAPKSAYKGLLLFHSVGTGKTCTAIATATASFDREQYTILWVTRTTLKSDIWKNMFGQICHTIIADEVRKGLLLPEDESQRKRLLSKNWVEPMSYKQFSNLLAGKNEYYEKLKARNGSADVIRRTLIIIDEAHKLYGGDLKAMERPDMGIMEELLQNSFRKSGKDSARLLLMTATPFTNSPMELFSLINLCKETTKEKITTDPSQFKNAYMSKENILTEAGVKKLADQLSGYISYINREHDATQFAQPIMIEVPVVMSHLMGDEANLRPYITTADKTKTKTNTKTKKVNKLQERTKMIKTQIQQFKNQFKETLKTRLAACKGVKPHAACTKKIREQTAAELASALKDLTQDLGEDKNVKKKIKQLNEGFLQEVMMVNRCKNIVPV